MINTSIDNPFLDQMMEEGLEALTLLEENDDNLLATAWLEKYGKIINNTIGDDLDEILKDVPTSTKST